MPEYRVDEHLGRIYGGRYRLVSSVGTGASARVYMAEDSSLRRHVAVKTLHPGLVSDDRFRKRFLAEAQVAAQLSHPYLLAVYDWGEHESEAYLVTELLSGGSLRDMLDAGRRLTTSQALLVGLHVSQGLVAAHDEGLVHRDVKPANLLFDDKGRVRVADFGIARAVAEATWTEPEGALIGTARYAAPEQAVSGDVDGRADVYSLVLTLIEAVTGTVPLVADTPIATMLGRQSSDVEVPPELGALRDALSAGGRADRNERPTAEEFVRLLRQAAADLPRPAPLPLVAFSEASVDADESFVSYNAETDVIDLTTGQTPAGISVIDEGTRPSDLGDTDVYESSVAAPARRWRLPMLIVGLLAVLGFGAYTAYGYYETEIRIPTHTVGNYVGTNVEDALSGIEVNRWLPNVTEVRRDGSTAGTVLEQTPQAGEELQEAQQVTLVVSVGQELRSAPEVTGLTLEAATVAITSAGFEVGDVDAEVFDETVPAGIVLSASPRVGEQAETGSLVSLIVSAGPEPRQMPDVTNQVEADATTALEELTFSVVREEAYSDDVAEGLVISAAPEVGTSLSRGSEVTIVVSLGLPFVEVPNVVGLDAASAADKLEEAGFVVSDTNGPPNAPVLATDPPQGEFHRKGTSVVIFTRR